MVDLLVYRLLKGFFQNGATDPAAVQAAMQLEKQGLVRCARTQRGLNVHPCLEGMDRWMQRKLSQERVPWIRYQPCFYGIQNPAAPVEERTVNGKHTLLVTYEPLKIFADSAPPAGPKGLCFADLFCKKIILADFISHLLQGESFTAALTQRPEGVFLDGFLFIQKRATVRIALLSLLIQHRRNCQNAGSYPYMDFEELADLFYQKTDLYIESIKKQIYRPLYELNQREQKLCGCDLIEFKVRKARLAPTIFCSALYQA